MGFGLANPALFRLMHTAMQTPDGRSAVEAGADVLRNRVLQVARAGRLRVSEQRAVQLIHAAGTGVVFALIDQPEHLRDPGLADLAWDAVCAAILTDPDPDPAAQSGPVAAAVTLRAALPELAIFTPSESGLLEEWLDRVADRSSAAGPSARPL
ncbi:MAG TPA: hypothetical protein VFW79_00720 [Cellulomonas sp.]|uniref:hypothetical protein n=1 Tax=Cellulomonas sp. TaxID=40001 RepID=UPI002E33BA6F|nr:hypothetical protein [Cellulomonas sp.]HEX5331142.1 hypothetical protein [Cellulomonas sp.]